jgi:ribosome-associated translation inhibitor RaiA
MNVSNKVNRAKEVLNSIIDHDDAEMSEVKSACDELIAHIQSKLVKAQERRASKAAKKDKKERAK